MGILVNLPRYSDSVSQQFIIEPLGGPRQPIQYTDRFPDELYRKTPESHLMKFLYTLLGPSGVGWIRKQTLELRLAAEEAGIELHDLDRFYADPFKFGRILEERWDDDPTGLLSREQWSIIRAKDERYRSRAIDFLNGARAGNTPFGMRLVARSGLGYDVEITENYRFLYDAHSDDVLGHEHLGQTDNVEEMIIRPRREISRSEVQELTITGAPTAGTFVLFFNGQNTTALNYNANIFTIQEALRDLSTIGPFGVVVTGGTLPANPVQIRFQGPLSNKNVPELEVLSSFTGGTNPTISINTTSGGIESASEVIHITARDRYTLQKAVDRIKPMNVLPTVYEGAGLRRRRHWRDITASSEFTEVARYVTGSRQIPWPSTDDIHWIESGVEKEAPKIAKDIQYHYAGFHTPGSIFTYSEEALTDPNYLENVNVTSNYPVLHIGRFGQQSLSFYEYLRSIDDDLLVFGADRILADYAEPLTVTTQSQSFSHQQSTTNYQLINGIYPIDYAALSGVEEVKYKDDQFWASRERPLGTDYIEFDFKQAVAVNYISFEIARKPVSITIDYDSLDQDEKRNFVPVTPSLTNDFPNSISFNSEENNPWLEVRFYFSDGLGHIPFTRYIRIGLTRREDQAFLYDTTNNYQHPWSIDIRNLRLGRVISNI